VAKLLNDAVDQTRRAEHQQLHAEGVSGHPNPARAGEG
jgi:hypothetical protein